MKAWKALVAEYDGKDNIRIGELHDELRDLRIGDGEHLIGRCPVPEGQQQQQQQTQESMREVMGRHMQRKGMHAGAAGHYGGPGCHAVGPGGHCLCAGGASWASESNSWG